MLGVTDCDGVPSPYRATIEAAEAEEARGLTAEAPAELAPSRRLTLAEIASDAFNAAARFGIANLKIGQ